MNKQLEAQAPGTEDWQNLKNDLTAALAEVKGQIETINKKTKVDQQAKIDIGRSFLTDLVKETEKIASSSEIELPAETTVVTEATGTESGEINNNCPEYINCMPTIGEQRPCQIPVGCESKTIIAY
jgi:glutamine synthetase adenylyltransferase